MSITVYRMEIPLQINKLAFAALTLLLLTTAAIKCDRQAGARRVDSGNSKLAFTSPCGTSAQVSRKVGECLQTIFDIMEGKFPDPKTDADIVGHCDRFQGVEKCVRAVSKDCLQGLHKQAVGAVAGGTKRLRVQECKSPETRSKYMAPMRCSNKRGKEMVGVLKNITAMAQAIRDEPTIPEEKLVKICCLLVLLDKNIEKQFSNVCPESLPTIFAMVHAMTDDAKNTLCIRPKCQNTLDSYASAVYRPPQNFAEPFIDIILMLNVS